MSEMNQYRYPHGLRCLVFAKTMSKIELGN